MFHFLCYLLHTIFLCCSVPLGLPSNATLLCIEELVDVMRHVLLVLTAGTFKNITILLCFHACSCILSSCRSIG